MSVFKNVRRVKKNQVIQEEKKVNDEQNIAEYKLEQLKDEVRNAFGNSADFQAIEGKVINEYVCFFYLESMINSKEMKEGTSRHQD
jgi:hypothetical protein